MTALFGDKSECISLSELVCEIVKPFGEGMNVQTSVPDVQVTSSAITPLTLVLFELATNSVKYGGLSSEGHGVEILGEIFKGRLKIEWKEVCICEAGSGKRERESFGTSLCQHTVSASLGGSFSRVFNADGLIATLDVDMSKVAEGS